MSQFARIVPVSLFRTRAASGTPCSAARVLPRALLGVVLLGPLLGQGGCKLVDQRTFDAGAGRKPVPVYPPAPPAAPPVPPLATVRFGAPPESWQPDLVAIVHEALNRKPDVLFTVQTVVPAAGSAAQQAAAIEGAVRDGGQPVAQTIAGAGAPAAQINMTATTEAVATPEIRITAR